MRTFDHESFHDKKDDEVAGKDNFEQQFWQRILFQQKMQIRNQPHLHFLSSTIFFDFS